MWLIATGDSGCGIAPECAAARSSSRSSLIPSFEDGSFHSSCVSRGSLCGQDVVRSRRACFVCDLGQIPRFPNRIQNSIALSVGGIEVQVPSQSGHGTTCIYPVVVGEMQLHSHSTGMIWQAGLICIFFHLEARTEMADCGQLGLS